MYVLTDLNGKPLIISEQDVPLKPETACEELLVAFVSENAVHWPSHFPLICLDEDNS